MEVSAGTAKFEAGMKKARATARANGLKIEKSFGRMRRSSLAASKSLIGFRSGLVAIGGATAFLGLMRKAISSSVKLEKGLREVGTLMGGLSKKEMRAMGDELKNISIQTGQALDKLVKAKYDIVSAGFIGAAESAKVLAASADLAVGGVTEISTAADLLTTSLNAYNLSADNAVDINDKLFTIVRLGKTTMTELAGSMGRVLAIAGQAGVSLDEVGAVMATLTAQGQKTEEATTAVRSAIVQMIKPTSTMQGVIEDLGFATGQAMLSQLGFAESLKRLLAASEDANIPITELFSNIRAMQAVLPLAGTAAKKFADNLEQMKTSSGAAAKAVEEMAKSTDFQLNRMKQSFIVIATTIAGVYLPLIAAAAEATADFLKPTKEAAITLESLQVMLNTATNQLLNLMKATQKGTRATKEQTQRIQEWRDAIALILAKKQELKDAEIAQEVATQAATEALEDQAGDINLALIPAFDALAEAGLLSFEEILEGLRELRAQMGGEFDNIFAHWLKINQDSVKAFQIATNAISSIGRSQTTRRINDINSTRDADIAAVLATTLSEEDKANKIKNINEKAVIDAQKARKKEKPFLIAQAIASTALGVVRALGTTGNAFVNLGLAAVVAAAGFAQVATIKSQAFATGGSFIVPGAGGTDSQFIPIRATPGERITVETPAQQGGGGVTFNVTINGPVDEDWFRNVAAPQLVDDARRSLNELQIR